MQNTTLHPPQGRLLPSMHLSLFLGINFITPPDESRHQTWSSIAALGHSETSELNHQISQKKTLLFICDYLGWKA
jgi:hypothetical protein